MTECLFPKYPIQFFKFVLSLEKSSFHLLKIFFQLSEFITPPRWFGWYIGMLSKL